MNGIAFCLLKLDATYFGSAPGAPCAGLRARHFARARGLAAGSVAYMYVVKRLRTHVHSQVLRTSMSIHVYLDICTYTNAHLDSRHLHFESLQK